MSETDWFCLVFLAAVLLIGAVGSLVFYVLVVTLQF
jgi:hypothetical protein